MTPGRSIAVAQTVPVRGDVHANLEQHLRLVDVAAGVGAQVLVFPELSLTGYEMDLARDLAFAQDDARLDPLLDAASARSTTLIVGAPVRMAGSIRIGALILTPDRSIRLYTKHYLGAFSTSASVDGVVPPAEATVFQPGDLDPLVELDGVTAAVAVCADTGRASHPRAAAERGARTYLASMFVIPSEFDRETASLQQYAVQHRFAVAMANYGGPTGGLAAAGRSAIWAHTGELVVQLESSGIGVALAVEHDDGWRGRAIMISQS